LWTNHQQRRALTKKMIKHYNMFSIFICRHNYY
jgi:hypothetical protein